MRQQGQDSGAQRPQHRLHQHHSLPDLVRDSKLETRFLPDGATQHTFYVTPPHASRRQRVRVDEAWRRERKLGKGGYGDVWLERCDSGPSTGTLRAVKEMLVKPSMDYSRELEAMTKFSHEKYVDCFVKCHGWYMSEHTVFIAMEYLEHGDLNGYLYQPLPEDQVKTIVLQLVEGLVHMHDNGFAHRDLKPLNILVHKPGPDWWVKIGDFGISKRSEEDNTALRTAIGTDGYMAPELKGLIYSQGSSESNEFSYTFAVDMWALGELTFRMATRRPAFPDPNDLVNYVLRGHPFPLSALEAMGASSHCCDFINKSMIADPGNRLTASEACRHPWLQPSRPSSRASYASPKTKSENPILSPNSSIQNGHLTATPSKPQLAKFENSAEWTEYSTRLQEPQASQSTSPFRDTAEWSTGTQDYQNSQPTKSFQNTAKGTGTQDHQHSHPTNSFRNTAKSTGTRDYQNSQPTNLSHNTAKSTGTQDHQHAKPTNSFRNTAKSTGTQDHQTSRPTNSSRNAAKGTGTQAHQQSQPKNSFRNTAMSTATQDYQQSQPTNSFRNTAKWSNGDQVSLSSDSPALRKMMANFSNGNLASPSLDSPVLQNMIANFGTGNLGSNLDSPVVQKMIANFGTGNLGSNLDSPVLQKMMANFSNGNLASNLDSPVVQKMMANFSNGDQGSPSSGSTILRDNIGKWSTGSQRAATTQAVKSRAEGRTGIPSLGSLSLNESKAPVKPPVTIDASLVNVRPTSTPLGSSSDSQTGFQGHNGFRGTPSSSSNSQTGFQGHNGFQGRVSGQGSLSKSKAAVKRPVTASTSLVKTRPTSTPLGSSGDSRMGYQRHNGFQGKTSSGGSLFESKAAVKRPVTAGTSGANTRSTSTPQGSSGDSQMGYQGHNGFQGKTSR